MFTMRFYLYGDAEGNVHVQNAVAGMMGQHHVHTPEDFEYWRKPKYEIVDMRSQCTLCDCGMKPGEQCNGWPERKES